MSDLLGGPGADKTPMPAPTAQAPMGEPRSPSGLARLAQGLFDFLERHPLAKLVALLWVLVTSIHSPIQSWRRDRAEAAKTGLYYDPRLELTIDRDTCALTNIGIHTIAEVSLTWKAYYVDLAKCWAGETTLSSQRRPPVVTHELRPQESISLPLGERTLRGPICGLLTDPRPGEMFVIREPCRGSCRVLVECIARYHRPVDMRPYGRSYFALVDEECRPMRRIDSFFGYSNLEQPKLLWEDESARRTWECAARTRRRSHPESDPDEYAREIDRLLGIN